MIAIKHPKINNIFPFLEWNILFLFGLFLIESIYVTIDTANNPKDPNITRISNLSYLIHSDKNLITSLFKHCFTNKSECYLLYFKYDLLGMVVNG